MVHPDACLYVTVPRVVLVRLSHLHQVDGRVAATANLGQVDREGDRTVKEATELVIRDLSEGDSNAHLSAVMDEGSAAQPRCRFEARVRTSRHLWLQT